MIFHQELHIIKLKDIIKDPEILIRDKKKNTIIKHRSKSNKKIVTTMTDNEKGDRRDLATNDGDGRKGIPESRQCTLFTMIAKGSASSL